MKRKKSPKTEPTFESFVDTGMKIPLIDSAMADKLRIKKNSDLELDQK